MPHASGQTPRTAPAAFKICHWKGDEGGGMGLLVPGLYREHADARFAGPEVPDLISTEAADIVMAYCLITASS